MTFEEIDNRLDLFEAKLQEELQRIYDGML